MIRKIPGRALLLLLALLAGCGSGDHGPGNAKSGGTVDDATLTKLHLESDAFEEGHRIPSRFTCDGADEVPRLQWSDPPAATRSFALVVDDPDAPSGTFRHWGVFDVPPSARSLGGKTKIGTEAMNDFGKPGYGGPCPPKGHGVHHYHFKLFALDTERLGLDTSAKVADVEEAARRHMIAAGELVGTYERS